MRQCKTGGKNRELAEEAVKRRHPGDRQRGHAEPHAQQRHLVHHALQARQHPGAAAVAQRPGHQEEQALGKRVVKDVSHAAKKGGFRAKYGNG
ncbi:hypothetical protein D3C80_2028450 [compost metagenome]